MCLPAGVLKRLEEEDLDEGVRKRLKDSSETPGALWHIYLNKDVDRIQEFLHKVGSAVAVQNRASPSKKKTFPKQNGFHLLSSARSRDPTRPRTRTRSESRPGT